MPGNRISGRWRDDIERVSTAGDMAMNRELYRIATDLKQYTTVKERNVLNTSRLSR